MTKAHTEIAIVGTVTGIVLLVLYVTIHEYNKLRGLGNGFVGNFVPAPPGPLKDV